MRHLIVGLAALLVLVSAAAANGGGNTAIQVVDQQASGNQLAAGNLWQTSFSHGYIAGGSNLDQQVVTQAAHDNVIGGSTLSQWSVVDKAVSGFDNEQFQTVSQIASSNEIIGEGSYIWQIAQANQMVCGDNNVYVQDVGQNSVENLLYLSRIAQIAYTGGYVQADTTPEGDTFYQVVYQDAINNHLVDGSDMVQYAWKNIEVFSDDNHIYQEAMQTAVDNKLGTSNLYQSAISGAYIWYDGNNEIVQVDTQTAENNTLIIKSTLAQIANNDVAILDSADNIVSQSVTQNAVDNFLVIDSTLVQIMDKEELIKEDCCVIPEPPEKDCCWLEPCPDDENGDCNGECNNG